MNENEAIIVFKALGARETTSRTQKKHGTSEWTLKTGEIVTEHSNGYVRKTMLDRFGKKEGCYQLNKVIIKHDECVLASGYKVKFNSYIRVMLPARAERLERLIKFAARKINKQ